MGDERGAWWSRAVGELASELRTDLDRGIRASEAAGRRTEGARGPRIPAWIRQFWRQLASPLVLILVGAALVSGLVGEWIDAAIIGSIVLGSSILGFVQEYRASQALARLRDRVRARARVIRDGGEVTIPIDEVVPGDLALLSAGSLVPGDGVVVQARDLYVSQAALTGEAWPVEKTPGTSSADAALSARNNAAFFGTNVETGTGRLLVVATGAATQFGGIAGRLEAEPPETDFERGVRRFGMLLTETMLGLVLVVFGINLLNHAPPIDSLLFAIALAVGIAPELLPAILLVNLSIGAQSMARKGVIVRRLAAIEDFGTMDVLCTDKTGTLTEGVVALDAAVDARGEDSAHVRDLAALNASFQTGLANALDTAVLAGATVPAGWEKIDELPYDFVRKRLSVVARHGDERLLITKGAVEPVLSCCTRLGGAAVDEGVRADVRARLERWGSQGLRVLAVATRPVAADRRFTRDDERDLDLEGFLLFSDPPKSTAAATLAALAALGVQVKVVTGDNRWVAAHLLAQIGLGSGELLTGGDLGRLSDEALWHRAEKVPMFAEVDPNQKERIIRALQRRGHVVGYLGDGINDVPALHAADVGMSVDQAVDVAKEAADFVLSNRDLGVLRDGIVEGRTTFANTMKYVLTTESANLGNMLSMAVSSAFLPFLPLLAKQILLNNFLSDAPAMAIARDRVDPEQLDRPQKWEIGLITRFMLVFGLVSAAFDGVTFATLRWGFAAPTEEFRTGWFVESLLTELAVALSVRSRRPLGASRPGTGLLLTSAVVAVIAVLLPYLGAVSGWFGFTPLPAALLASILGITVAYVAAVELTKRVFWR